ncbi:acyl-CoA dehydrogenase [Glycomyces xiaoerkulensis]|uniref:acyl-CoA dehydrogenase n=1 Tax=Glycomyces xiaoerkulensis TaxID=2038139 RepID=UPI000C25B698|nr:acyl-CoA dehydrogenase [Glycomyces xiaoerkulensis]
MTNAATDIDRDLGDPRDPANPYGFTAMAARDAAAAFPRALAERVGPRLRAAFVPAADGGDLVSMDRTLMQVRAVARRDAAVMPATMFSITAVACILAAGSAEQRERAVRLLREGGAVGFALSEEAHGSDLLANACAATAEDAPGEGPGYVLDGEKWLVGLGERCEALLVVARTGTRGPGAFSALLLEGAEVDKARTGRRQAPTGMRGIDFSGFAFDGLRVRADALVGREGQGLETAMKAMQVVRAMSTGANLACTDTALRLAWDFASGHEVAGTPAARLPNARREWATAAALHLAGDVVALTGARGLHALPAEQSLWSSVAKKVLTDTSEEIFARCADVLGTRSVMAEGPYAAFDTVRRDNAMVRYIDTGPVANSRLIIAQLPRLVLAARQAPGAPAGGEAIRPESPLADVFTLDRPLPELDPARLKLSGRGPDPVFDALPAVAREIRAALPGIPETTAAQAKRLSALTRRLERAVSGLLRDLTRRQEDRSPEDPMRVYGLADRLCLLHAAASCLHLWWCNRDRSLYGLRPGSTAWLPPVLAVLLSRAFGRTDALEAADTEQLLEVAEPLYETDRMFSCTAPRLATTTDA